MASIGSLKYPGLSIAEAKHVDSLLAVAESYEALAEAYAGADAKTAAVPLADYLDLMNSCALLAKRWAKAQQQWGELRFQEVVLPSISAAYAALRRKRGPKYKTGLLAGLPRPPAKRGRKQIVNNEAEQALLACVIREREKGAKTDKAAIEILERRADPTAPTYRIKERVADMASVVSRWRKKYGPLARPRKSQNSS